MTRYSSTWLFSFVTNPLFWKVRVWFRHQIYFLSNWHQNALRERNSLWGNALLSYWEGGGPVGLGRLPLWESVRNCLCFWEGEVGKREKKAEFRKKKLRHVLDDEVKQPELKPEWLKDFLWRGLSKTQWKPFKFLQLNAFFCCIAPYEILQWPTLMNGYATGLRKEMICMLRLTRC